jgi:P-type conjugative transfer protein TrbJ
MFHDVKHSRRRHTGALAIALGLSLVVAPAPRTQAQLVVLDPVNLIENIISAIQNIYAVAQQVQQLSNEATQISNQVQQLRDMANQASQLGSPEWGEVQSAIAALTNAVHIGQSIAYDLPNLQEQFQTQFPGYVAPTNWNTQYQQWSRSTLDTLNGTLRSAGLNIGDFSNVDAALGALRSANDSASGRNELMQVANSLASLQVAEMTKMRQLLALEINAQNVWKANATNTSAASEAALQQFIGTSGTVTNPAASGAGFNP